jgi:hypothetical protein
MARKRAKPLAEENHLGAMKCSHWKGGGEEGMGVLESMGKGDGGIL